MWSRKSIIRFVAISLFLFIPSVACPWQATNTAQALSPSEGSILRDTVTVSGQGTIQISKPEQSEIIFQLTKKEYIDSGSINLAVIDNLTMGPDDRLYNSDVSVLSFLWTPAPSNDGSHTANCLMSVREIIPPPGPPSSALDTNSFFADNTNPTVSINVPDFVDIPEESSSTTITIYGGYFDSKINNYASGVQKVLVNDSNASMSGDKYSGSWSKSITIYLGPNYIIAEAIDYAGNGDYDSDAITGDPTFIQQSRKFVIVGVGTPKYEYNYYGYSTQDISLNPSSPTNIPIYQSASTDKDAQITIPQDSLSKDVIITINNADKSDAKSQLVKAQYNTAQAAYGQGIKSQVNTAIVIDTQSYINEAIAKGMNEQAVTEYINNTVSSAQSSLNTAVDSLIGAAHNSLLPTLQSVNAQITDKVNSSINDAISKEGQFAGDKEAATQRAYVENNASDLVTQLRAGNASQELIDQIEARAEEKAASDAAIAVSLLEAAKFNDIKILHDEANLFIQNLVFDTNRNIISQNNTLRRQITGEKDTARSGAEKDIITYVRGSTDTIFPVALITSPAEAQNISGTVSFTGTASDDNIKEFRLSYFDGLNWNTINSSTFPVTNFTLGTLNTITGVSP